MRVACQYWLARLCESAMDRPTIAASVFHPRRNFELEVTVIHISCYVQIPAFLSQIKKFIIDGKQVFSVVWNVKSDSL